MATNKEYIIPVAVHPGRTLKEWLEENNMTSAEFALRSNKPTKTISLIINGKSAITPDTAEAFEIVTRIPSCSWTKLQALYDSTIARLNALPPLERLWKQFGELFPYADMAKRGWVEATKKPTEKMNNLLRFFGLTTEEAFNQSYLNNMSVARFRATGKSRRDEYSISAWLRQGEIISRGIEVEPFDPKKAKEYIPLFKQALNNSNLTELVALCAKAGIKLVFVENIPTASMSGAAMRQNKVPLIILSGKGETLDKLAFNFFHELGHILLGHCAKTIFVDDMEDLGNSKEELEANQFASATLLSAEGLELVEESPSIEAITEYAQRANIDPSIVLGHLTHTRYISFPEAGSKYKALQKSIEIDYSAQCQA